MQRRTQFTMMLSADEARDLGRLAEAEGESRAVVLRRFIRMAAAALPKPIHEPEARTGT
jgi:hypothetical protein